MLFGSGPSSAISRLVIPPARNAARRAESSPSIEARRVAAASGPCQRESNTRSRMYARASGTSRVWASSSP